MQARFYSPEMKRFINADIIPGQIYNAITLNRFDYANGNPFLSLIRLGYVLIPDGMKTILITQR